MQFNNETQLHSAKYGSRMCLLYRLKLPPPAIIERPWDRRINNGVMQPGSRQHIAKHLSAGTNTDATIELLLETWFYTRSVQRGYKLRSVTRVESESNTSTVILRVIGGDEMRSLKSESVKYGCESQGARTRERLHWQGPAACTTERPVLSLQRAPTKNKTVTVKQY
jgi:hypothetical protein